MKYVLAQYKRVSYRLFCQAYEYGIQQDNNNFNNHHNNDNNNNDDDT